MSGLCPRTKILKGVSSSVKKAARFSIPYNSKTGGFAFVSSTAAFDVHVIHLLCREYAPVCVSRAKESRTDFQNELYEETAKKRICEAGFDAAHLYVFRTAPNKHYLIAFIESGKLPETDALITRLLKTAEWLKISDKCPVFYVYYYDKEDKELGKITSTNTALEYIKRKINKEIKERIKYIGSDKEKDVFLANTLPGQKDKKHFVINAYDNNIGFNPN